MRSSLVVCAALAGISFSVCLTPVARAADKKSNAKASKKTSGTDALTDDKVIGSQLQWEDSVMGPDDKRAELDKIARAQAMNKAAAEKAAKEKEKADAEAAKQAAAAARAPKKAEKAVETAASAPAEPAPKLEEQAAAPPPPPAKPADDKFIDKLLHEDGSAAKKRKSSASTADNKDLLNLLATDKPTAPATAAKGRARKDNVDNVLSEIDKAPAVDTRPKAKAEVPEWEKPEIQSTAPAPAPVVARPAPKHDDGIIHVVQGAAGSDRSAAGSATAAKPAARPATASSSGDAWVDPFMAGSRTGSNSAAAAARRGATAPSPSTSKPDSSGHWKDPFTASEPSAGASKPAVKVATRMTPERKMGKRGRGRHGRFSKKGQAGKGVSAASKWELASKHASTTPAAAGGSWGAVKKRQ